jgi:ABC-2 type transport system permease protein
MFRLLVWETRHLLRGGQAWLIGLGLLVASLVAIWAGERRLAEHAREIAALPGHYATQMERIARDFTPEGEAGYVSYYTFYPTHHAMPPLAGLSFGVRDLVPNVVWVRLLGLEGQLYESDLGNPLAQALGSLDLAFVWCALAPLALLVLCHDVRTRDRDHGRLPLLAVQDGSPAALFFARLAVRFAWVALIGGVVFALAAVWLGIPFDAPALSWVGVVWVHLACWAAIAGVIAALARTVAASLALALTTWTAAVVLLPALLNLVLVTVFPVTEGLELTVKQRQESHAAWDKPRAETMEKFFARNPDWSGTPPVQGRFAWRWYYAMQEMGDQSVATESENYRRNLRARQAVMTRVAWLAPSAYAQLALSASAGTDLDAHLAYLDRVRAFHAHLRHTFYPLFFAEAKITPADYAKFPRFDPAFDRGTASGPPLWPLLVLIAAGITAALLLLRRKTTLSPC